MRDLVEIYMGDGAERKGEPREKGGNSMGEEGQGGTIGRCILKLEGARERI